MSWWSLSIALNLTLISTMISGTQINKKEDHKPKMSTKMKKWEW